MPAAIKNLTSRTLFVSLNSGTNLRLSSGEVAGRVPDVELENNSQIDKLIAQRGIAVEPEPKKRAKAQKSAKAQKRAKAQGVEPNAEPRKARKKG
jgi:hypothetical protein